MVVTGASAAAATASATFDDLFDPPASLVDTVGHTCSPESRPRRVFGCRYARVSPLTWGWLRMRCRYRNRPRRFRRFRHRDAA